MCELTSNLRRKSRQSLCRPGYGLLRESQTGSSVAVFVLMLSWHIYALVEKILSRGIAPGENCKVSWISEPGDKKEKKETKSKRKKSDRYTIFDECRAFVSKTGGKSRRDERKEEDIMKEKRRKRKKDALINLGTGQRYRTMDKTLQKAGQDVEKSIDDEKHAENGSANLWNMAASPKVGDLSN